MKRLTRVEVRCDCSCGKVLIPLSTLQVSVCTNAPALSAYVFRCPLCFALVQRIAEPATVAMLMDHGAKTVSWSLPIQEQHTGPAITPDDVLDFALGLRRDDFAKELTS